MIYLIIVVCLPTHVELLKIRYYLSKIIVIYLIKNIIIIIILETRVIFGLSVISPWILSEFTIRAGAYIYDKQIGSAYVSLRNKDLMKQK
jgi:hypothetical protein